METQSTREQIMEKLNRGEILLIKKALRLSMHKFNRRGEDFRNIDDRILANKFEKVLDKIKFAKVGIK